MIAKREMNPAYCLVAVRGSSSDDLSTSSATSDRTEDEYSSGVSVERDDRPQLTRRKDWQATGAELALQDRTMDSPSLDSSWDDGSSRTSQSIVASQDRVNILDSFVGIVEDVREGIAYVTLRSDVGVEWYAEYPAEKLQSRGISVGRQFICKTVEDRGKIGIRFFAIPDRVLTHEEEESILQGIANSFSDGEIDGDD